MIQTALATSLDFSAPGTFLEAFRNRKVTQKTALAAENLLSYAAYLFMPPDGEIVMGAGPFAAMACPSDEECIAALEKFDTTSAVLMSAGADPKTALPLAILIPLAWKLRSLWFKF